MALSSHSRVPGILPWCLAAGLLMLSPACEESLPPLPGIRDPVQLAFRLNVEAGSYAVISQGGVMGTDGGADLRVRNLYDEVLSDDEQISAEVTIWQTRHPERRVSFQLGKEALQDPSMLLGSLVAIRPGQELRLLKQWPHSFGAGTPFWTVPDSTYPIPSSSGKDAGAAFRVFYTAHATVRIFRTRPTMYSGDQNFMIDYRFTPAG